MVLICLILPQAASAGDYGWDRVVKLAEEAIAGDSEALAELRSVESIDGFPVSLSLILDGEDLEERLVAIVELGRTPTVDQARVDRTIESILSEPAFPEASKSLLQRVLGPAYLYYARARAWISDVWSRVILWALAVLASILEFFSTPWTAIGGLMVIGAVTAVAAYHLGRKRAREIEREATIRRILELGNDPADLESLALGSASAGNFAEAIRMWFVAGLLRLDADGAITFSPGIPNGVFAEALQSAPFDRLVEGFNQVVYGRRDAAESDWIAARADWDALTRVSR